MDKLNKKTTFEWFFCVWFFERTIASILLYRYHDFLLKSELVTNQS
jgi:hypothetical protein